MALSDNQILEYNTKGYLILDDVYDKDLSLEFSNILASIINSFNLEKIFIKDLDKLSHKDAIELVLKSLNDLETLDHKYIKIIYDTVRNTDLLNRMTNSQKILNTVSQLMGYENALSYADNLMKKILIKLKKHGKNAKNLIETIKFIRSRSF